MVGPDLNSIQVVSWINMPVDSNKWHTVVRKCFTKRRNFWTADLLDFHEGIQTTWIVTVLMAYGFFIQRMKLGLGDLLVSWVHGLRGSSFWAWVVC